MPYLLATTLIWAFSFSLIGGFLTGLDPHTSATIRLGLAWVVFLPFLRLGPLARRDRFHLAAIGAVQFGLMYTSYMSAFLFAPAYIVALFSCFTPIWVAVIGRVYGARGRWCLFSAAILATTGALIIKGSQPGEGGTGVFRAFFLMQVANAAFAWGQVAYRNWKLDHPEVATASVFALPYLGGFLCAAAFALGKAAISGSPPPMPSPAQWGVLVYLGVIASGIGFFLWNTGASRVSTGLLAVANNLVVPLAVIVALLLHRAPPAWGPFLAGTLLITLALRVAPQSTAPQSRGREAGACRDHPLPTKS